MLGLLYTVCNRFQTAFCLFFFFSAYCCQSLEVTNLIHSGAWNSPLAPQICRKKIDGLSLDTQICPGLVLWPLSGLFSQNSPQRLCSDQSKPAEVPTGRQPAVTFLLLSPLLKSRRSSSITFLSSVTDFRAFSLSSQADSERMLLGLSPFLSPVPALRCHCPLVGFPYK